MLASIAVGRGLIPVPLFTALLAAVIVTIALSTTLVRVGHPAAVPAPGGAGG